MKNRKIRDSVSDSDDESDDVFRDPIKPSPRRSQVLDSEDEPDRHESPDKNKSNVKGNFFIEDLSSDDEVYTFQCPSDFSKETLFNVKIDFNEVTQFKEKSGEFFNARLLETQSKSITCALPSKRKGAALAVVPIAGHIVIQKDVSIPDVNLSKGKDDKIDFPTDLKVRHPLLGADWEKYISGTSKVITRLGSENGKKRHRESDVQAKSPKKKSKHK